MTDREPLQSVDSEKAGRNAPADIEKIRINEQLSKEERISEFIRDMKNPYICKCKDMVVQSVFADTDVTLTERLIQFFSMI